MGALRALCLLVLVSSCLSEEEKLQVKTKYGDVEGLNIELASGKHIHAFFGIPYAEPPVGELRFTEARPPKKWDDVRDATKFAADCPQEKGRLQAVTNDTHPMSEDCLYLNIYAPDWHQDSEDGHSHPVIVVFPGFSCNSGTARTYDGSALTEKETVVVTVNFRIGVFGFLSTDDEEALGNYALLDQIEALKWVQDNIDRFGGDPKRVTIMGSGAAGNMVALHLMSPYSEGLFHRAIISSGSMVSPSAVLLPPYKAVDFATELAEKLGCSTETTKEIVSCLREKTVDELVMTKVQERVRFEDLENQVMPMSIMSSFLPTVDGPGGVIAASPRKMIENNQFSKVPLMIGTTDNYGAFAYEWVKGVEFGMSSDMRDKHIDSFTKRYPEKARSFIHDIINFEYTDFKKLYDPASMRENIIRAGSDYFVNAPMVFQAAAHAAAGGPVWMYEFHHVSKNDPRPKWTGADALNDFMYIFGQKLTTPARRFEFDDDDKAVQNTLLDGVSDFARTADPTPVPEADGWRWPRYQGDTQPYVEIRTPKKSDIDYFFKAKKTALWTYYIPKLLYDAAEEGEKDNVNPFGDAPRYDSTSANLDDTPVV